MCSVCVCVRAILSLYRRTYFGGTKTSFQRGFDYKEPQQSRSRDKEKMQHAIPQLAKSQLNVQRHEIKYYFTRG